MDKHLGILAALNLALGAFGLLGAGFVLLVMTVGSLFTGDPGAMWLGSSLGVMIAGLIVALSLPSLIAGVGHFQRKPWSRPAALLAGALNFINVPFGPLLGIYTIWIFLHDEPARRPAEAEARLA